MPDTARVLYIDDDEGLGRLIRRALAPQSIDVVHVATGDDGLKLLADGSYDAVALDHDLVHETGLDVIAEMKRRDIEVPVIFLTGSEDARVAVAQGKEEVAHAEIAVLIRDIVTQTKLDYIHVLGAQQRVELLAAAAKRFEAVGGDEHPRRGR